MLENPQYIFNDFIKLIKNKLKWCILQTATEISSCHKSLSSCEPLGHHLAHRAHPIDAPPPLSRAAGCAGVTNTLIVRSSKATGRRGTGGQVFSEKLKWKYWQDFMKSHATDALTRLEIKQKMAPWMSIDWSRGLFKDCARTMSPVCGLSAWKGQRRTLPSLKVFSRAEMNWLESNFITRWRMEPFVWARAERHWRRLTKGSAPLCARALMRLELQNICHLFCRTREIWMRSNTQLLVQHA